MNQRNSQLKYKTAFAGVVCSEASSVKLIHLSYDLNISLTLWIFHTPVINKIDITWNWNNRFLQNFLKAVQLKF